MANPNSKGNPKWTKGGPSPNPGGRPKAPFHFRKLYDDHLCDDQIFKRLIEILNQNEDRKAALKAAEILMDRRYGKVPTLDDDGNVADQTITVVIPNFAEPKQE